MCAPATSIASWWPAAFSFSITNASRPSTSIANGSGIRSADSVPEGKRERCGTVRVRPFEPLTTDFLEPLGEEKRLEMALEDPRGLSDVELVRRAGLSVVGWRYPQEQDHSDRAVGDRSASGRAFPEPIGDGGRKEPLGNHARYKGNRARHVGVSLPRRSATRKRRPNEGRHRDSYCIRLSSPAVASSPSIIFAYRFSDPSLASWHRPSSARLLHRAGPQPSTSGRCATPCGRSSSAATGGIRRGGASAGRSGRPCASTACSWRRRGRRFRG